MKTGDKLFLGTNYGTLYVYDVEREEGNDEPKLTLKETKKGFVKRQTDQLGVLKDVSSLVVLSGKSRIKPVILDSFAATTLMNHLLPSTFLAQRVVTLFPLPALGPPTVLTQTRNASVFAIDTSVQYELADGSLATPTQSESKGIATVVTVLAVGCKRKIVIFRWHDGEAQPVKELALDHTPRAISFPTPHTIAMAYPPPDHAMLSLTNMALTEFVLPATNTVTQNAGMSMGMGMGMGMGALSGLGGYMGLGAKAKQAVVKIEDGEVLIPKESTGLFFGVDGQTTRPLGVDWPAAPEETVYTKPYIISSFPPNSLSASSGTDHSTSSTSIAVITQQTSTIPNSALQIRSSLSLQPVQTLRFPFIEDPTKAVAPPAATAKSGAASKQPGPSPPHTLRLLTATPGSGPSAPTYVLSTPTDRTALASEGSTLWALILRPWAAQVDELVHKGKYADALALLGVVPVQPDPTRRVRGLRAVQLFKEGAFEKAVEMFLELDMNPAKVIALYPETISGRLATPREKWIELFGGDTPKVEEPIAEVDEKSVVVVEGTSEEEAQRLAAAVGVTSSSPPAPEMAQSPPASISGGLTGKLRAGLGAMKLGDSDADSIREPPGPKGKKGAGKYLSLEF
ncbi:Vacuolar morphogenesis protein 6 [Ceratobasidium sp. 370]|nr:Vacuolar morphogenesis protein 6 [Ceratobasidium sp. 370]